MNTKPNQCVESTLFCQAHPGEIAAVESGLVQTAYKLLCNVLESVFPPEEVRKLKRALDDEESSRFFYILRSHAATFIELGVEQPCWNWIDAYGFYLDAVGTRWPYMTQERRKMLLDCAAVQVGVKAPAVTLS